MKNQRLKLFMSLANLKDYIAIIVLAVGLISNVAVSQYQIGELQTTVIKLTNERDQFIRLQTQQEELTKKVDEIKKQNSEMYRMVYSIYSNRQRPEELPE